MHALEGPAASKWFAIRCLGASSGIQLVAMTLGILAGNWFTITFSIFWIMVNSVGINVLLRTEH